MMKQFTLGRGIFCLILLTGSSLLSACSKDDPEFADKPYPNLADVPPRPSED